MRKLIHALPTAMALLAGCAESSDKKETSSQVTSSDTLDTDAEKKGSKSNSWQLKADKSTVSYTVTNFGKSVDGRIGGLKADIKFDKDNPEKAAFDASVKVSTMDTDNAKRDKDLMNDKYFNESKFPGIIFRSNKIAKRGDGYIASGELTIKGVSQPLDMPFEFEENGNTGVFTTRFTINRHDYNIGGNGPILGDDIKVNMKVVAEKGR